MTSNGQIVNQAKLEHIAPVQNEPKMNLVKRLETEK